MTAYILVTMSILPEFISSGFIGLTASLEPDEDMQTRSFPDVLASHSPVMLEDTVILELENPSTDVMIERQGLFKLQGPVPISQVKRVLFPSEASLSDFKATYGMLPDIPLQYFVMDVIDEDGFQLIGEGEELIPPKFRTRKLKDDPAQLGATLVGVCAAAQVLGHLADGFPELKVRHPTVIKICDTTTKAILKTLDFSGKASPVSLQMFELYCESLEALKNEPNVDPGKILALMKKQVNDKKENEKLHCSVNKVLGKIDNIMMGLDSQQDLSDNPQLILQRAVFLACMAKNLESFDSMRKNLVIGPGVEAVARLLVAARMRLNRIAPHHWRESKEQMDHVLAATASCIREKVFTFKVERTVLNNDFKYNRKHLVCGEMVLDHSILPIIEVQQLINIVKECGYIPYPDNYDRVTIKLHSEYCSEDVEVFFHIPSNTTKSGRKSIQLSVLCAGYERELSKKAGREKLLTISSDSMLSVSFGEKKGDIFLSRYQYLDALDEVDFLDHIDLLIKAASKLRVSV